MTFSSDDFDSDIRAPLYELLDALNENYATSSDKALDLIHHHLVEAIGLADDYRIDLMDAEDDLDGE